MITFGSGYEAEDMFKSSINTRQLSMEIQEQIQDYISRGGRIRIVDQGFCKAPELTSWTNDEAAIKARKNGTKNSKLRAVK